MNADRFTQSILTNIRTIPMSNRDRVRAENHVRKSAALVGMLTRLLGAERGVRPTA